MKQPKILNRFLRDARDSTRQWYVRRHIMSTNQALAWNRTHSTLSVFFGLMVGLIMSITGER